MYSSENKNLKKIIIAAVIAVLAIILLCASITIVPTGYTGVRKTFGQVSQNPVDAGFNLKIPFVQTIKKVCNKQQDIVINTEIWGEASDRTPVYANDITITYQIPAEHSARLVATVKNNIDDLIDNTLVSSAIKMSTRELDVDNVTNRAYIEPLVLEKLNASLAQKYGEGAITVLKVAIDIMDFEEAYNAAIQAKSVAQQEAERQAIENKKNVEKAEADKQVKIAQAQAEAEAKRIAAEAEAEANKKVSDSLNDKILESKFYETWNGELPEVMGDNAAIVDIGKPDQTQNP